MTYLEKLYASLAQTEDRFTASALAYRRAENLVRVSRSQEDMEALFAAAAEFDAANEACEDLRDQIQCEEMAVDFRMEADHMAVTGAFEHAFL